MEAQNLVKRSVAQALVNALFLVVGHEVPVQFERGSARLKLALSDEHDTVNAGTELLGKCERIASGVGFANAFEIFVQWNQLLSMKRTLQK